MASIENLTDSFDDNSIDTSKWDVTEAGNATVSETAGRLVLALPASAVNGDNANISSVQSYSLTGSHIYGQIIEVTSATADARVEFGTFADDINGAFIWWYETGALMARRTISGATTTIATLTYDPAVHRWWRIREDSGTIYWDTSTDGETWTNRATYVYAISIATMEARFYCFCDANETDPGRAVLDNFNTTSFIEAEKSTVRKIAHNLQVSWKKETTIGNRTFAIGVSTIGGNDVVGIDPGAVGGPGIYRYFDESDYVTGLAWERGLNMPTGGLSKAMAEVQLDNTSGRFTPRYMGGNSELFTAIQPRKPLIINAGFHYDGIDNLIPQFSGILTEQPMVKVRNRTTSLRASDYVDFFQNRYLDHSVMFTSERSDTVLESVMTQLGMATSQYELDTGLNIIKFGLFDTGTKFSDIIHEIVMAENGHFYQDEEGRFRFENRTHWDSSPHNAVQRVIFTGQVIDSQAPNDDHIINAVEVIGSPREVQAAEVIWQATGYAGFGVVTLQPGEDTEFWANYNDPIFQIDTPVRNGTASQTSYFVANTLEDGTGTDGTSDVYLKHIDNFAQASKLIFHNNSSNILYITDLTIVGRPARRTGDIYYREEYGSSITDYEERVLVVESAYIQDSSWARSYAGMILEDFSRPENIQKITIRAMPDLKLGDLVSWQGRHWRIFDLKSTLNASVGFIQELTLLQRTIKTYFRIGISTIGGSDMISP